MRSNVTGTVAAMNPYENLANAIVVQAAKDYRTAIQKLKNPIIISRKRRLIPSSDSSAQTGINASQIWTANTHEQTQKGGLNI